MKKTVKKIIKAVPEDISQSIFDTQGQEGVNHIVLPPPFARVHEKLDDSNRDLPGYVYRDDRDKLNRDEQGLLMKSYIRIEGFSTPFINAYNQKIGYIRDHLSSNFKLDLGNGHIVTIKDVFWNTPLNTDGTPTYPNQVETERVGSYLSPMEVVYVRKNAETGEVHSVSERQPFGAFPIMVGSILCNLYTPRLLETVYPPNTKWATDDDKYIAIQKALMKVGESMHEPYGWFAVEGSAKTIHSHARLRVNKPLLTPAGSSGVVLIKMTSVTISTSTIVEIMRTIHADKGNVFKMTMPGMNTKKRKHISVVAIFYIFGIVDPEEMARRVIATTPASKHKYVQLKGFGLKLQKILTKFGAKPHESLVKYLLYKRSGEKSVMPEDNGVAVLAEMRRNLFVHMNGMPSTDVDTMKINMLAYMVGQLALYHAGQRDIDDRDAWSNKRIETGSQAFFVQYLGIVKKFQDSCQELINKHSIADLGALTRMIRPKTMTEDSVQVIYGNIFGFKTPNKNASSNKENVTEVLKRDSLLSQYGQIRRINTPVNRKMKHAPARSVHPSQFLVLCPAESPEGPRIGLVNNLAVTCSPTLDHSDRIIHEQLIDANLLSDTSTLDKTHVAILNGKFIGWVSPTVEPWARNLKIKGIWPRETCIVLVDGAENVLYIYTDSQRPVFPLLIVNKDGTLVMRSLPKEQQSSFSALVEAGAIEYLDSWEYLNAQVAHSEEHIAQRMAEHESKREQLEKAVEFAPAAMKEGYRKELDLLKKNWHITHMVIDPTSTTSIATSLIPYYNHATASRNTYGASMGKQAMGIYRTNDFTQFPTTAKKLVSPNKPVFKTQMDEDIGHDDMPHGVMANIAVMPWGGVNNEDAFTINRDTMHKFASIKEFSKTEIMSGIIDKYESFGIPIPLAEDHDGKYAHIDPKTGAARVGTYLREGMVVIARYAKHGVLKENKSVVMGIGEEGMVSVSLVATKVNHNQEVKKIVRVKMYKYRVPQGGDKFTSRYAQKTTIGRILPSVDMPFSAPRPDGSVSIPDIIINPLPLSNRMTINKAFELFGSKPASMQGTPLNGTAYRKFSVDDMMEYMENQGFKRNGTETMINPFNGQKIKSDIMIGPLYYQVLRHQVADKTQARGEGAHQMHTGQATRGRSEGGAIRFGVMERTALFSYGASAMTKERLMVSADEKEYTSCAKCSGVAIPDLQRVKNYRCSDRECESNEFVTTKIPHALLYLKYILAAGNFHMDIKVEKPKLSTVVEQEPEGDDYTHDYVPPVDKEKEGSESEEEEEEEEEDEEDFGGVGDEDEEDFGGGAGDEGYTEW